MLILRKDLITHPIYFSNILEVKTQFSFESN